MTAGTTEVDEIFDVKNAFYIGNFQNCVKEAQNLKCVVDPDANVEKDVYMYRAYIAMRKFGVIRDEVGESSHELIQPLKILSQYFESKSARERIVKEMEEASNVGSNNTTFLIVCSTILIHEEQYENALRILHSSDHLECSAIKLQALLKMDRVDLARKELKIMQDTDDDATLTQLATAWVNLAIGGDKIQDAYYVYQELIDKFGSTPTLLNGQASSFLAQGKYEEAEAALQEAMEKDSDNPDTLINMIVLALQSGKPVEVSNRYLTQLKDHDPNHSFVQAYQRKENDFERMRNQYSIST